MPTREECLREAAKILVNIAIRVERQRINGLASDPPGEFGLERSEQ